MFLSAISSTNKLFNNSCLLLNWHLFISFQHLIKMDEPMEVIDDDTIGDGKYIIIRRTFETSSFKLVRIGSDKYFYMGKQKINISSLDGQKFGSTFELTNDKSLKLVNVYDFIVSTRGQDSSVQKDNRFIKDDNTSQKLTRNDIEKIKKEVSGQELIKTLVENSSTFEEKNKFSQQKYLVKKQQKYLNLFTVLKPSVKFLMEMYFAKGPAKNCYLRIDSLSQMLTLCNVMAGGNYMVVDSNLGIFSAALMERTAGLGHIVQVHTEDIPSGSYRQAVHALNYPESTISQSLLSLSLSDVCQINYENGDTNAGSSLANAPPLSAKKEKRLMEISKAKALLAEGEMHGLLILTKDYDPCTIVNILIEFLGLSRPFAIFCSSMDPLKECYAQLKRKCLFLRISETWLRKYQVLNDRTRPEMVMSSSSGFILSGIKADV